MEENKMLPGEKFEGVLLLKKAKESGSYGSYYVTLSDKNGAVDGTMMKEVCSYEELCGLLNKAVKVTAFVDFVNGNNFLKLLSIAPAGKEEAEQAQLVAGINGEEAENLKTEVRSLISEVKHEGYRALLTFALRDTFLDRMATYPATLSQEGAYAGGLLYKSVMLTKIAYAQAKAMEAFPLQCHGDVHVDYDLLITAGLLHAIGKLREYTDSVPFQKSEIGYYQGPRELSMQTILACEREIGKDKEKPLDNLEHARLSSAIGSVYHEKGMHAVLLEGTLLSNANMSFKDMDMHVSAVAEARDKADAGFVYNKKHGGYVCA